jgi:hypothetical protein
MNQEIIKLLKAAIECSIFLDPIEPGLSYEEILEVGTQAGYQAGEVSDAAPRAGERLRGFKRIVPDHATRSFWHFLSYEEPELRNFEALDFIVSELNDRVRADGARNACLDRNVIVERAVAKEIPWNDIQAAITYQVLAEQLTETSGVLRFPNNGGVRPLPSEVLKQLNRDHRTTARNAARAQAYPIVKDIIERRMDGRPRFAEPLDAFAEQLDRLGYGVFRMWWTQTVAELRRSDVHTAPLSISVLAAALVEGALTFVVKHARELGAFRSPDFDKDARTWQIENLVGSAASGGDSAVLDLQTKARAESLIRTRQRIHAGRMLSEFPAGVPDIRPEEGREAKATADQVVRRVLDWLQKFPPS